MLPRGTVCLEILVGSRHRASIVSVQSRSRGREEQRRGRKAITEFAPNGTLALSESLVVSDTSESPSKDPVPSFPFIGSNVVGNLHLRVGDQVSLSIMEHKRTKKQRVTEITLVQLGGERETGVIHSIKDGFGFIKSVPSSTTVKFHSFPIAL